MNDWSDEDVLQIVFLHRTLGYTSGQVAAVMGCTRNSVCSIAKRVADAKPLVEARALPDNGVKLLCDRLLTGKKTASDLAKTFDLSRLAIMYQVWLVMNDLACAGPDDCWKPENDQRVKWPSWWQALPARGVAA